MAQGGISLAFVAAKLARPHVGQVPLRPDTLNAFRAAAQRRLVVVCAPAGYGKTTTTAAVLERDGTDAAWYKLDVLDHDPVVFIVALTYAMRERRAEFGELLLERVQSSAEVPFRLPEMVALFVAECAGTIAGPVHIVLDDYQEAADSAELNWTLDYLLENLPPQFHFIVLSRYDPSFSIAKLKLADQFQALGVDTLRFDAEQTAAIMSSRSEHVPTAGAIRRLLELTEGWPASLVLVSFALEWLDLDSLESALADPRLKQDIYSYLAEQVYLREDGATRAFLQQTCCLEQVTAELGDLLAGIVNAERQLRRLAANRVFTFASDEEGAYRYHNLFRDYLRQRFLQEHGAAAFHALRIRTIEALEACKDIELAVDLSLTINEPVRALDIVARAGEPEFDNIRTESLQSWVSRLEWSTAAASPWTTLLRSQARLRAGEFDAALAETDAVLSGFAERDDHAGLYHAYSVRECALFWKGDMAQASTACELALTHARTPSHRAHTLMSLGSAALETRDWDRAEEAYAQAEELIRGVDSHDRERLRALKAMVRYHQGDARGAWTIQEEARLEQTPRSLRAAILNSLAVIELARGDYKPAQVHCRKALAAADEFGSRQIVPGIQDNLGLCLAALGDPEGGMHLVVEAGKSSTVGGDASTSALSLSHLGTIMRRSGRLPESLPCYKQAVATIEGGRDRYVELNCRANLELVEALLGREDRVVALLEISAAADQAGLAFVTNKALLYAALVHLSLGRPQDAERHCAACVPELLRLGQLGLLVQETRTEPALLPLVVEAAQASPFADELSKRLPGAQRPNPSAPDDPLTKRETQVLALMAQGKRNSEIAQSLYLSMATVKTHVNHIFSKLGVDDRVKAVIAYRDLERAAQSRHDASL